jgi:hypothetical protein
MLDCLYIKLGRKRESFRPRQSILLSILIPSLEEAAPMLSSIPLKKALQRFWLRSSRSNQVICTSM